MGGDKLLELENNDPLLNLFYYESKQILDEVELILLKSEKEELLNDEAIN